MTPVLIVVTLTAIGGLVGLLWVLRDPKGDMLPDPGGHVKITEAPYDWAEELTDKECERILEWVRDPEEGS